MARATLERRDRLLALLALLPQSALERLALPSLGLARRALHFRLGQVPQRLKRLRDGAPLQLVRLEWRWLTAVVDAQGLARLDALTVNHVSKQPTIQDTQRLCFNVCVSRIASEVTAQSDTGQNNDYLVSYFCAV